jgi:hypothetical protein
VACGAREQPRQSQFRKRCAKSDEVREASQDNMPRSQRIVWESGGSLRDSIDDTVDLVMETPSSALTSGWIDTAFRLTVSGVIQASCVRPAKGSNRPRYCRFLEGGGGFLRATPLPRSRLHPESRLSKRESASAARASLGRRIARARSSAASFSIPEVYRGLDVQSIWRSHPQAKDADGKFVNIGAKQLRSLTRAVQ